MDKTVGLSELSEKHKTDKGFVHSYIEIYENIFQKKRLDPISILEIGVGGYQKSEQGGNSLRMWKEYFPNGKIFGIDIHEKNIHEENRIKIFKGCQTDKKFIYDVVKETGPLDFIVDDGSHVNSDVIKSFEILFHFLKAGGFYCVEDTQTSYFDFFGGSSVDLNYSKTSMNYFKSLTDGLNYAEFDNPLYCPTYLDKNILSIHFYHNLVVLEKGKNGGESNLKSRNPGAKKFPFLDKTTRGRLYNIRNYYRYMKRRVFFKK